MSDDKKEQGIFNTEAVTDFPSAAEQYKGQKCAVLCARYQYRGVLVNVNPECMVLADATAVEVSGQTNSDQPQTEDAISGAVTIKNDAVEIIYQPQWCFAALPSEDGYNGNGGTNNS